MLFFNTMGCAQPIIHSFIDLKDALSGLPENLRHSLLTITGFEYLHTLASWELMELLSVLPEESRNGFLKGLDREFLQTMVLDTGDLISSLIVLPNTSMDVFLHTLGVEYVRSLIKTSVDLRDVLNVISPQYKSSFLTWVGVEYLGKEQKAAERLPSVKIGYGLFDAPLAAAASLPPAASRVMEMK